jgi:transcriptional regulator with XRE-family HTH domain
MGSSAIHGKRYQSFLKKLRQAREDSGMTQREVAAALGKLQSFVEKCEQGSRRVDAAELFEFAEVYGKPVEFFDPDGHPLEAKHKRASAKG